MLISAVCPACETSYNVQPSLRGKTIRCQNPQCRHVFTVPTEEPPAESANAANGPGTGSVGEMVPLVEALPAEPPAPKAPPSWKEPPPVRRPTGAPTPTVRPRPEPAAPPAVKAPPRELPPGTWEPPPVRRGPAAAAPPAEPTPEAAPEPPAVEASTEPAAEAPVEYHDHAPTRRTGWLVAVLLLVVVVLLGGGGVAAWLLITRGESWMAPQADAAYKEGRFAEAAPMYKQLEDSFPNSDRRGYYHMMKDLSDLRKQAADPDPDVTASLDALTPFLDANKDVPDLKEHAPDLADVVGELADAFARKNTPPQDDTPLVLAKRLGIALDRVTKLDASLPPDKKEHAAAAIAGVENAVHRLEAVKAAVARIEEAARAGTAADKVRHVEKQIKKEARDLPDIGSNADVQKIRQAAYDAHKNAVVYDPKGATLDKAPPEPVETRFVVDPLVSDRPIQSEPGDPVVLAVTRGILYALRRSTGQVRWTARVGVDTTELPVRVPAARGVPERILVPSADDRALDAFDADGNRLWRYRMAAPCIGQPLVVDNVAYLSAYDGNVHEIELAQGKLLGVYPLGQPLTAGGARDPATHLLYFPADDSCVYVINPDERRCVQVLYTGHPAGSLRGAPLIVAAPDANGIDADWLLLAQSNGLGATRLRAYRLGGSGDPAPEELSPAPEVPGFTWFPPSLNGEQLAMVGDTGDPNDLRIFDIRQERNPKDPLLFPAFPFPESARGSGPNVRGRSEVVEVRGQDFWVLAGGLLRRMSLGLDPAVGPRLAPAPGWDPPPLGSPLHASQVEPDPVRGGTTLVLATQPPSRQISLTTALDDRSGGVLWQRQLGLVCPSDPVQLRPPGGGPAVLLTLDQGGGLFAFDPAHYAGLADGEWREAGQMLFGAMDDGPGAPPVLLAGPDGSSAYEMASPGDGKSLVIRRVEATANGMVQKEQTVALPAALAGTPAVMDAMIVLPLADGVLAQLPLPLAANTAAAKGPNWRSRRAAPDARGRVTPLGGNEFLSYDGARGLTHWQWPLNNVWNSFPAGQDPPTLALPEGGSLTADPAVLPPAANAPRQVCIADVSGAVTLLTVTGDGALKPGRSWNLGGPVTAGPYVEAVDDAVRIGCVVDRTRLAWIDPEKDGVLWSYPEKPGAALVGRPRLIGGLVVVADQDGRVVGLDPKTGVAGPEYRLQGSAAPTASPAGFGADRLFVPLTDGTILLPRLQALHGPG